MSVGGCSPYRVVGIMFHRLNCDISYETTYGLSKKRSPIMHHQSAHVVRKFSFKSVDFYKVLTSYVSRKITNTLIALCLRFTLNDVINIKRVLFWIDSITLHHVHMSVDALLINDVIVEKCLLYSHYKQNSSMTAFHTVNSFVYPH